MFKIAPSFYNLCFVMLISSILAACGGGGGGGGGGRDDNPAVSEPRPTYNGARSAVDIDEESAVDVASMAIEGRVLIELAEAQWIPTPGPSSVVQGTETIQGSQGGSATITTSVSNNEITVDITYSNFTEAGTSVSGRSVQIVTERVGLVPGFIYSEISGSLEFINVKFSTDQAEFTLDGLVSSDGGNSQKLTANLLVINNTDSESILLENYVVDFSTVGAFYDAKIATSLTGDVFDSVLGMISVTTVTPMVEFEFYEPLGLWSGRGNGLLQIQGTGKPLRLMTLSPNFASLMFDDNNDNVYEKAMRVSWAQINELEAFDNNDLDSAPIANTGNAIRSYVGIPTTIHGQYSHDNDNQFLDYSWKLIHAPSESNLSRETVNATSVTFSPDTLGDHIYRLTVNDGDNTRTSAVKVTIVDNPTNVEVDSIETTTAALEITEPNSGQTDYEVDGTSSSWYASSIEEDTVRWVFNEPFTSNTTTDLLTYSGSYLNTITPDTTLGGYFTMSFNSRFSSASAPLNINGGPFDFFVSIDGDFTESVQSVDFNNDGLQDLLTLVHNPEGDNGQSYVEVWLADDQGGYTRSVNAAVGPRRNFIGTADIRFLTVGDLNSDNRLDVVVSRQNGLYILRQTDQGSFENEQLLSFADQSCTEFGVGKKIGIGDYNGDGRNDLLTIHSCNSSLIVWEQNAMGEFDAELSQQLVVGSLNDFTFTDINDDGLIDIFLSTGFSTVNAQLFKNTSGSFDVTDVFLGQQLSSNLNFYAGDFTNDDIRDVVLFDGTRVYLYQQLNNGQFELYDQINAADATLTFAAGIADIDNDGDKDIVYVSLHELSVLTHNDGEFMRAEFGDRFTGTSSPDSISIMDYNKDGALDIVLPNNRLMVFLGGVRSYSVAP